jgi:hypothetical protein
LASLRSQGLTVRADAGRVILGPRELLTPAVLALVAARKPDILAELTTEAALELARVSVAAVLAGAAAAQRYAFEVIGPAPLLPEPGAPVLMMLAARTGEGITTGVLEVPRESFDSAAIAAWLEECGIQDAWLVPDPEPAELQEPAVCGCEECAAVDPSTAADAA